MRRVYYAYALRLLLTRGVVQSVAVLAALIVMTYFVSLGNVFHNLLNIRVGDLDQFVTNAFLNTEAWTLLSIGVIVFSLLSLRIRPVSYSVLAEAS